MRVTITYSTRMIVLGGMGSGKTYFTFQLLNKMRRVLWIDPSGDLQLTFKVPNTWKVLNTANIDIMRYLAEGNMLIVLDDMDSIAKPWTFWTNDGVQALFTRGRHRTVGYVVISHGLSGIPKLAWKQAQYLVFFHTTSEKELDIIKNEVDPKLVDIVTSLDFSKHEKVIYDQISKEYARI